MKIKNETEKLLQRTVRIEPDLEKFIKDQNEDVSSYVRKTLRFIKDGRYLQIPSNDFELVLKAYDQDPKFFLADALSNQLQRVIQHLNNNINNKR